MTTPTNPPAGWYPEGTQLRYWDGGVWTNHTRPMAPPAPNGHPHAGGSGAWSPQVQDRPATPPEYPRYPANSPTPAAYPHLAVAAKSPGLALLASFFIPGLGSMMNGEVGKGVLLLCGYIVSFFLIVVFIGFIGILAFWIWGMVDAYQGAQRWNARYGILS